MATEDPLRHAFLALLVFVFVSGVPGCGYPEVSPKTYEVANALYAAANRQSVEHIDKAAEVTDELLAAGEISEREAGWLNTIAEQARSGDWDGASNEARSLIADQVKPAP